MFLIRESFHQDVDQILEVAKHLDTVNLPADRGHIERIVDRSARSFTGELPPFERELLFVLEDRAANRIIGTSIIHAQHGTRRSPHVFFRLTQDERYSETLDRYMVHHCLQLGYNYDGPTEIGGLILLPEYRGHAESLGKTLSYSRFLFIAMHREIFRDQVISELLPPLEEDGTSRLWKHLGRVFTGLTYQEADLLSKDNKEFIRALFPHTPIYTALFPASVREVIAKVGPETVGVEKILRRIGFEPAGTIDPFDGGPHFIAETDRITVVANSVPATVTAVETADSGRPRAIVAISRPAPPRFRAVATRIVPSDGDRVGLPETARALLEVTEGDRAWMTPL
jgi:arginine N-succinyltransferase